MGNDNSKMSGHSGRANVSVQKELDVSAETRSDHKSIETVLQNTFKLLLNENDKNMSTGLLSPQNLMVLFPQCLEDFGYDLTTAIGKYFHDGLTTSRYNSVLKSRETIGESGAIHTPVEKPTTLVQCGATVSVDHQAGDVQQQATNSSLISQDVFVKFFRKMFDARTSSEKAHFYLSLYSSVEHYITTSDYGRLLKSCYIASSSTLPRDSCLSAQDERIIEGIVKSQLQGKERIQKDVVCEWLISNDFPVFDGIHQWLCQTLTVYPPSTDFVQTSDLPISDSSRSALYWVMSLTVPESFFSQSSSLSSVQMKQSEVENWQVLYDSNQHGLSINRFEHHVLSYPASTVVLVVTDKCIFFVTCMTEWRKSSGPFGGSDCTYIEILPNYRKFSENNMITWNDNTRHAFRGIKVQKSGSASPLAFIPHDFNTVTWSGIATNIHCLKVLGCGDVAAKSEQRAQKEWEKKQVQKSQQQKLRLEPNWNENADKKILEMAGVTRGHVQR